MRPFISLLVLAAFLLSACTTTVTPEPLTTSVPANTPVPPTTTPTPAPQRAPLLRVAILGEATTTNVWALFDETGAAYWNAATQTGYWPSLYHLAPPDLDFEAATAKGEPSPVDCSAAVCTATVTLRPNLFWTDGSPLAADDVAFTANTALQFRLGLNWQRAYNPDVLDHAETQDENRVKFYFKTKPAVADWQYGALLGPIVNRAYWQPRIVDAISLLPDETLLPTILELEDELAKMQAEVDELNLSLNSMAPESTAYADTTREAKHSQDELNSIYNKLQKNKTEYETKLADARESLFALGNANEPTLGSWKFASRIEDEFENRANLGTLFGDPWFDAVRYITYPNELAAARALANDDVDLILTPEGLSSTAVSRLENNAKIMLTRNSTRSARFLAFNHGNPYLADPALHLALACMLDPQGLKERLGSEATPLSSFVLDDFWQYKEASLPCFGQTSDARLREAVRLLKEAGYSWSTEPASGVSGTGLVSPSGLPVPDFSLLTLEQDDMRDITANYIAQQAETLGLILDVHVRNSDDLIYAVYGSRDYDMALLAWRLSAYPSYLCGWFLPLEQNPFAYGGSSLTSACEAWSQTNDLDMARNHAFEVQSVLMHDLPLIPLYSDVRVDAYRNIQYPFSKLVDGLGGLYGAPGLAMPIP